MEDKHQVRLGAVQQTLFIPLAARAKQTQRKHPVLRDPKAVEMVQSIDYDAAKYGRGSGGSVTVLRTAIIDFWVRGFLAAHPAGTVVEIGTGLNTRFERVDNGQVHWFDLDLPDTIELRRTFFADTERRRMVAASVLDEGWLPVVAQSRGPYFFVADGVLVYLPEDEVATTLARIAEQFPGALIALDTYPKQTFDRQHRLAAKKDIDARWAWPCDDPRSLERLGLEVMESASITRPPRAMRSQLPARYRYLMPLADPVLGKAMDITLFRASSPGAAG
jgi:O-methyltransferase involved in polyketide biosynthesis